jgi:hypothetical protein
MEIRIASTEYKKGVNASIIILARAVDQRPELGLTNQKNKIGW